MHTTSTAAVAWRPDEVSTAIDLDAALPEAFVNLMTSKAGDVEGDARKVRVPFIGADPEASVVAEGDEIAETSGTLAEVEITTAKVAVLSVISNEQFATRGTASRLPFDLGPLEGSDRWRA